MSFLVRLQRITYLSQIAKSNAQQYINHTRRHFSSPHKKTKVKRKKTKNETESITECMTESTVLSTNIATQSLAATSTATSSTTNDSSSSDWWRMKFYKFRRMAMIIGMPLMLSTGLYALHDSDIPYVYCMKKLADYPLPDDYDPSQYGPDNPPPSIAPTWAVTLPMLWAAQFNSHRR